MGVGKKKRRLLVVQVAGLGWDFVCRSDSQALLGQPFRSAATVFPAVTSTVQATFRTATLPAQHGVVANGWMERELRKVFFWEQSSTLVQGKRVWEPLRAKGGRVALLYWQQSLGEAVDVLLSPAPIHTHHGSMLEATYSRPDGLYDRLVTRLGGPFALRHYWGPMASVRSSDWISRATAAVLHDCGAQPDLCLTYLPGLDYDLQRYGPDHVKGQAAWSAVRTQLERLLLSAAETGYDWLVYGDYAIVAATRGAVRLNLALRQDGWLQTRRIGRRLYADLHASRAFAVPDHEVAHVYVSDPSDAPAVEACVRAVAGVEQVMGSAARRDAGLDHRRSGELVAVAAPGAWFTYDWWEHGREAPDYARHVDIHSKPGFDPRELFWGWPPGCVSLDTGRVGGTHGRTGDGRDVAIAASCGLGSVDNVLGLARWIGEWSTSQE